MQCHRLTQRVVMHPGARWPAEHSSCSAPALGAGAAWSRQQQRRRRRVQRSSDETREPAGSRSSRGGGDEPNACRSAAAPDVG